MKPTWDIDLARMNSEITKFAAEQRKDLVAVLRDQARLFVRDVMRATPPHVGGKDGHTFTPKLESDSAQRKAGEGAVERDIRRVFIGLDELDFKSSTKEGQRLIKALKRYAREGRMAAAKKVLGILFHNPDIKMLRNAEPGYHQSRRGRRGRVSAKTQRTLVLNAKTITSYIKVVKGHVGKAKAGWVAAASKLGSVVPGWVKRHSTPGSIEEKLGGDKPMITIANLIPYGPDFGSDKFKAAIDNRIKSMRERLAYVTGQRAAKSGAKTRGIPAAGNPSG